MNTTNASILQPLFTGLRRSTGVMLQRVSTYLDNLWALSSRVSNPAFCRDGNTTQLKRGEVMLLHKASCVSRIEVATGMVWLTGTPSQGDVIIKAGSPHQLGNGWPFVLQALEDTVLTLDVTYPRKGDADAI